MTNWLAWLTPALSDATEAELIAEIAAGRAQLWPGETAAMVTQCVVEPQGRALHVWLAGGDLAGIMALKPGVEAWGRAMGCQYVTIEGRAGWARVLRRSGYLPVGRLLKRML